MIFMQKVANGPDLIFVEFRKTVVRSTHPLYKCATTYLHTLHTVAKLKFLLKKWNLKKIFKKNKEKIIFQIFFLTKLNILAQCVLMMRLCEFTTTTERSIQSFPSLERKLRKLRKEVEEREIDYLLTPAMQRRKNHKHQSLLRWRDMLTTFLWLNRCQNANLIIDKNLQSRLNVT